ncbi:M48 family metallopeptidase [Alteromonas sp. 1_MG-2023]|uniref:M48 family metallopeptidase n=1 Tax=Alteromonas sp. 1_MG-2023 TaxID=3062669 RepID=UPI0026E3F9E4|nr:M48 family metallopeptidase [Alteromonas sp. 1_MG-2023]MDO6566133.1 M48 family metallopeptidase [Alteromonas sp. 1_MG-2023]
MIDGQLYQSEGSSVTPITASIEDNALIIRFLNDEQCVSKSDLVLGESNTAADVSVGVGIAQSAGISIAQSAGVEISESADVEISESADVEIVKIAELDSESTAPLRFEQSQVNAKSKLGNLPREITLPNDRLLVCSPSPLLDQWLDGGAGSRISQMETRKRWLIASVLLVPLLLYVIFVQGMPWAAVKFADQVPYSIKTLASQHTLSALDYSMLEPSTLPESQRKQLLMGFDAVLEQVVQYNNQQVSLPTSEHRQSKGIATNNIRVHFRDSEIIGPNAFALPDGTIVFTDDLVTLVDGDQGLLDAILLHEIGHVAQNHSMQMVAESLLATLAISYFFGDISGAIESFMGIGTSVIQNQYSQKHEWQADNFAISQLKLMQRSPADFADVMRKLSNDDAGEETGNSWFQSHPTTKARIENAEKHAVPQ